MLCRFVYLLVRRFLDVLSGRFRSRVARDEIVWVPETRSGCSVNLSGLASGSLVGERARRSWRVRDGLAGVGVVQAAWRYSLMSPPQVGCRLIGCPGRYSTTPQSPGARCRRLRWGRCVL